MGKPENLDEYEEFQIVDEEDIIIYVENKVLKYFTKNNCILIVLEGYGRYEIMIQD